MDRTNDPDRKAEMERRIAERLAARAAKEAAQVQQAEERTAADVTDPSTYMGPANTLSGRPAEGGVVGAIDQLFTERFDALVSSMHLGKPPRGHGGSSGHGGGRKCNGRKLGDHDLGLLKVFTREKSGSHFRDTTRSEYLSA